MDACDFSCDVLVIGGGLAALTAAFSASLITKDVLIACKKRTGRSGNSLVAANGFAAFISGYDREDSLSRHFTDTMAGGTFLNDEKLVRTLVEEAGSAVEQLEKLGVKFLSSAGVKMVKKAPGHTGRRFFSVDGGTLPPTSLGQSYTLPLYRELCRRGVRFLDNTGIITLAKRGKRVAGAIGFNSKNNQWVRIQAKAVIIAAGGGGRIYNSTNNTADVTGDGYALAYHAGAALRDMEFIQFFPIYMVAPVRMTVPTPVLGDGAVLRNSQGRRFMFDYSSLGEMATRDIMARAVYTEILSGRKLSKGVQIDFSQVPRETIKGKYYALEAFFSCRGQDLRKGIYEVAPVVHHFMGGIAIDETCRTGVPSLFAAGEAAGGVHGANRLGGNALSEAAVFGTISGQEAARESLGVKQEVVGFPVEMEIRRGPGDIGLKELKDSLRKSMDKGCGVIRSEETLKQTLEEIKKCREALPFAGTESSLDLPDAAEIKNMCLVAEIICRSALMRKESRGAHFREDYPLLGDTNWKGSIFCHRSGSESIFSWHPKTR